MIICYNVYAEAQIWDHNVKMKNKYSQAGKAALSYASL